MRRFEYREGSSQKFWCVAVDGNEVETSWGRLGTAGQKKAKSFGDREAAKAAAAKMIAEKTGKGYVEVTRGADDEPVAQHAQARPIPGELPRVSVSVAPKSWHKVLGVGADGELAVAVGGQGTGVFHISNDGRHFIPRPGKRPGLRGAHVRGDDVWVVGEWGYIARSPDQGLTWKRLTSGTKGCLFGVVEDESGRLWIAGDDGYLAVSKNGKNFKQVDGVRESIGRISTSSLGVLVPTDAPGYLYVVEDDSPRRLNIEAGVDLMQAAVTPRGALIAVGDQGAAYRSTDAGEHFVKLDLGVSVLLTGVACFADGRVVICGGQGSIFVSCDDGASFERIYQDVLGDTFWCCRRHGDAVLVGGAEGTVLCLGELGAQKAAPRPLKMDTASPSAATAPDAHDASDRPHYRVAPIPDREQAWSPEELPTEIDNGIYATPEFRASLYPRRGGIATSIRPVPPVEVAWAALLRALWAADRANMQTKGERSQLWKLVTSAKLEARRLGERILDPAPRAGEPEEDAALVSRALARYDGGFGFAVGDEIHERIGDFLVASVGLEEAARRALVGLGDELPYTGPGPFGRLRELFAAADEGDWERARGAVLETFEKEREKTEERGRRAIFRPRRIGNLHWAATFLLPLGPKARDEERALHDRACEFIGKFGSGSIKALGLAAGDVDTLKRVLAANDKVGHEFFSGHPRMYLSSVLELAGAEAADTLAKMKPGYPWEDDPEQNGRWCFLLSHIDHDAAREAMLAECETEAGTLWGTMALVRAARIDRERTLGFLRGRGQGDLVAEIEGRLRAEPIEAARESRASDVRRFGGLGAPVPYQPVEARHPAVLEIPGAPKPTVDWRPAELELANQQRGYESAATWNGESLRSLGEADLEAFVAHREKWQIPTAIADLYLTPASVHDRLQRLGFAPGDLLADRVLQSLMARIGLNGLAVLLATLEDAGSVEHGLAAAQPFGHVAIAGPVAKAFSGKKHKAAARAWILRHPRHAAAGAIALWGQDRKAAPAQRVLRFLDAQGLRATLIELSEAQGLAADVVKMLDLDPLTAAARKKLKLPAFATPDALPPLVSPSGEQASAEVVEEELFRLASSNADEPHPAVPGANERYTADSREAFAWALFEAWLAAGADAKQVWCLQAVGFWGGDESAKKLTALAKKWPGEGAAKRAQWALDALANIGTDSALTSINLLAEKSRFPAFKTAAQEKIATIAEARGLGVEELADRLAPRLDLDEEDAAVLNFGPRRFTLSFDESLMPVLRDEDGKPLKALPKPRAGDDKGLAKAATARFKALKQAAKAAASLQITRLERAMQQQREIPAAVFVEHFVSHPWMVHLAKRLVWSAAGTRFRIAEDNTFSDQRDERWELPDGASVRVTHALELAEAERGAWASLLADYEIAQPFPQIDRPIHAMTAEEASASKSARFAGREVHVRQLLALEREGWRRWYDVAIDGFERPLGPGAGAVLHFEPGWHPSETIEEVEDQRLTELVVHGRAFADLDAITFSELVYDIERVLAR